MPRINAAAIVVAALLLASAVRADQIPVVFTFDDAASEVQVSLSIPGSMDSSSTSLSGTLEAMLEVADLGGGPGITEILFTGGTFMNEQPLSFSLRAFGIVPLNLVGTGFEGTARTPVPPSIVSADPLIPRTFHYDAADHELSFDQGVLEVSGAFDASLDLSENPVSGMPPAGSIATLELVEGTSTGDLTEFAVLLTQPLEFEDTFDVDAGIVTLPLTVGVAGQATAAGSFSLNLGPGGDAGPGDYNGNGRVEQGDLDLVLLNWGAGPASVPSAWQSHLPSGAIDQQELDGVLLNWGNTAPDVSAAVPEPGSLVLWCIACALAMRYARPARGPASNAQMGLLVNPGCAS